MKDKFVKFLKFGYVSENVVTYGIFFIAVILYLFKFRWGSAYIDTESTNIQKFWFYTVVFYFRYVETILVILLIKLVLEYFVQNQRLLRDIASSKNIDDRNTGNITDN